MVLGSKQSAKSVRGAKDRLDGRVHGCMCPDCRAPMTVRLWLMTADCWRCGTSTALSYEYVAAARKALAKPQPAAAPPEPRPHTTAPSQPKHEAPGAKRALWPAQPTVRRDPQAPPPSTPAKSEPDESELMAPEGLRGLLAWLISAIVHLLLMILLGLLTTSAREKKLERLDLVLSVDFDRRRLAEEIPNEHASESLPDFDLPVARKPQSELEVKELELANEEAKELRLDPKDPAPFLHAINSTREDLRSRDPYRRMHATRDPRLRSEVIRQEGGTTLTEAAVARALRWLARHQNRNGSWSIHAFHRSPRCHGRCDEMGSIRSDVGGTALALQAFLGAAQTHRTGIYRDVVAHGLQFMLEAQESDGDLRGRSDKQAGMYVHAQATIVLCEAYKLTGDTTLRGPAQRAIDFLCAAQHQRGGWRYVPGQRGDTSVIGWQLMALHTAKAARLGVPDEVFEGAADYLDRASVDDQGALYAYQPGGGPTAAMTAEGLLSRMYLGWDRNQRGLKLGTAWMLEKHPPSRRDPNIYYWYYATQVFHHWGGAPWRAWNLEMRDILVTSQKTYDHEAGSWDPRSPHGHFGGRLYMTALACCTLEVYYRHAPLYRRIKL